MSVIAWDGETIAADSQSTNSGARSLAAKLFLLENGDIAGFTGDLGKGLMLVQWWEGKALDGWPKFQATEEWCRLVIFRDGKLFFFEQEPVAIPVLSPYAAFGSGRDFALGAMAAGAIAVDAVAATCKHSVECGGPIVFFKARSK